MRAQICPTLFCVAVCVYGSVCCFKATTPKLTTTRATPWLKNKKTEILKMETKTRAWQGVRAVLLIAG